MGKSAQPIFGLVLSGGRSERMGRDKGQLTLHGHKDQRTWCFELLTPFCEQTFISCRKEQAADVASVLPRIYDRYPGMGPASGLLSAHQLWPHAAWLVLACDMPAVTSASLARLLRERNPAVAATVYGSAAQPEPFFALWESEALLALAKNVKSGDCSPQRTLLSLPLEILKMDNEQELQNLNAHDDLQRYLSAASLSGI